MQTADKKPEITVKIIKEKKGYGAYSKIGNDFIATCGDTFEELKKMILEAVNLAFDDKGLTYSIDEIALTYDMESFFAFYKVINAKALSERIGMNQSLLSQYISGRKKPSPKQTQRILNGIHQIGKELSDANLLM